MPHFSTIRAAKKKTRKKITRIASYLIIISFTLSLNSCLIPFNYVPAFLRPILKPITKSIKEKPRAKKAAEPLDVIMERYKNSSVCCSSFKEFGFDKLEAGKTKDFEIDEDSKASAFHSGKSWFASFELPELPEFSEAYTISIKSYLMGDNLEDGYVFSPQIIFLNKDYNITKTIITGLFEYTGDEPGVLLSPNARLEARMNIGHEQRKFKYMIILTPEAMLGKRQDYSPTKKAKAAVTGRKVSIIHSPAGLLKIELSRNGE